VLVRCIENLWLLAGPFVNNQYPLVRSAGHSVHPHLLIVDALTRRAPGETGELVVRDLREGSYVILEKIKNEANAGRVKRPRRKKAVP
jgi:DNA-binding GntR family transcriptional regulator